MKVKRAKHRDYLILILCIRKKKEESNKKAKSSNVQCLFHGKNSKMPLILLSFLVSMKDGALRKQRYDICVGREQ